MMYPITETPHRDAAMKRISRNQAMAAKSSARLRADFRISTLSALGTHIDTHAQLVFNPFLEASQWIAQRAEQMR